MREKTQCKTNKQKKVWEKHTMKRYRETYIKIKGITPHFDIASPYLEGQG